MENIQLDSQPRVSFGKGAARKLRRSGLIPAVVYREGKTPTHISIDPNFLSLAFEKSGNPNHLVEINTDGNIQICLVKSVQRHPVTGIIRHVDFFEVKSDEEIQITVPISIVGKAVGVQMGGALRLIRRTIDLLCKPNDIPSSVPVDVTNLEIGKFVKASQVPSPENTDLVIPSDFNIVTVVKRRGKS